MILFILTFGLAFGHRARRGQTWSYDVNQGEDWLDFQPQCAGKRQSPINIDTALVTPKEFEPFHQVGYEKNIPWAVSNTGHGIKLSVKDDDLMVFDGGLDSVYKMAQFHFHWGSATSLGSEHLIDSKRHFAEVHFVHYKYSYGGLVESLEHGDGLAVLGFFIDVDEEMQEDGPLDRLIDDLIKDEVQNVGELKDLTFNLSEIAEVLKSDSGFYRYMGSLTTPGCHEVVVWTVFEQVLKINSATRDRMISFAFTNKKQVPLVNNYRKEQDLRDRHVTFYTTSASDENVDENKSDEDDEITGDTVGGKIVSLLQLIVQLLSKK